MRQHATHAQYQLHLLKPHNVPHNVPMSVGHTFSQFVGQSVSHAASQSNSTSAQVSTKAAQNAFCNLLQVKLRTPGETSKLCCCIWKMPAIDSLPGNSVRYSCTAAAAPAAQYVRPDTFDVKQIAHCVIINTIHTHPMPQQGSTVSGNCHAARLPQLMASYPCMRWHAAPIKHNWTADPCIDVHAGSLLLRASCVGAFCARASPTALAQASAAFIA